MALGKREKRIVVDELYDAENDRLKDDALKSDFFLFHERTPRRDDFDYASRLTLLLTTECNAGCLYCFADPQGKGKIMSFETAKEAIDSSFRKMRSPIGILEVVFFGAGEPTIAMETIKKTLDYLSDSYPKRYSTLLMTNGMFNESAKETLLKMDDLCVSCDGPAEFQNASRPFTGGAPSSLIVEQNVRSLVKKKKISIKSTITEISESRQEEILEYIWRQGVDFLGISPLALRDRGERNGLSEIDNLNFTDSLLMAIELAETFGMRISTEYLPLEKRYSFCGFDGPSVAVTPDGHLSSCWESCEVGRGSDFIYGELKGGDEITYADSLRKIKSRTVENIPDCQECFLKWTCAGGCVANHYKVTNDLLKTDEKRCDAIRKTVREYLLYVSRKESGVWSPKITRQDDGQYLSLYFSKYKLNDGEQWDDNPIVRFNEKTDFFLLRERMNAHRESRGYEPTFFVFDLSNEKVDNREMLRFGKEMAEERFHIALFYSEEKVELLRYEGDVII